MSLTWPKVILFTFLPLGQIYARVAYMNNSVDKKWLLFPLFLLPPLQLVAMLAMKFGYIKKGLGGKPYDMYMLIPIIMKFITPFIADRYDFPWWLVLDILITWVTLVLPYMITSYNKCQKINIPSAAKAMSKATILQGYVEIMSFVVPYIPVIGSIFGLASSIPFVGEGAVWALIYTSGYVISNILFIDNEKSAFCNKNDVKKTFAMLAVVGTIGAKYVGSFL